MSDRSESNEQQPIDAELLPPEPYDFDFIASTLGLIPYEALSLDDQTSFRGALNPGAIINLEIVEEGQGAFTLHGGEEIVMDAAHLTLFEETLKRRIEEQKAKAKEAMKDNIRMQAECVAELNAGVQPGMIVGGPMKRGRLH